MENKLKQKKWLFIGVGAVILLLFIVFGGLVRKNANQQKAFSDRVFPTLKPADAIDPASGICRDYPDSEIAEVAISEDIPDPKCMKVLPGQRLKVVNKANVEINIYLGDLKFKIASGSAYTAERSFGEFLAPGVHVPVVAPLSGPEIWVQ
ncbi:MAG: hypothetical protein UX91_C0006G0181 [Candidatus Amesbacteria bacterium GW2011_GWB1_47_19]|nr:MAG: hypothetical protein UW51_C0002G0182 [Candidatus Amesbacteria bacterium GW2011_GWA1_44_24]KKU31227.1 MAG: hypothetical protein UX46_C0006G0019 [Candidatus Amesbacteria bacterium GW2011_GWC1_46_24]KKU67119.1 MAG: hypothetical protein UX91_C0006G0181 [Candidatus Amesbacteria bacterium GW2011_GWB1_47_19]